MLPGIAEPGADMHVTAPATQVHAHTTPAYVAAAPVALMSSPDAIVHAPTPLAPAAAAATPVSDAKPVYAAPAAHAAPADATMRPLAAAPVDQIDDPSSMRATPRPARRRNRDEAPSEPLVFIETVAAPASTMAVDMPAEAEAPRRRTPRPRGPRVTASEPLQFVETKSGVSHEGDDKSTI